MDNKYSIFRKEVCPVCQGFKYIEVKKECIEIIPCENCNGKGYLKILKDDYDY